MKLFPDEPQGRSANRPYSPNEAFAYALAAMGSSPFAKV
jgi:hypothetical protein